MNGQSGLGNNQIGYASPRTTSLGVTLNIPLSPSTQISKYVKTDSSYQFGIVFSDYAGRKCGVVTNDLLKVNSRRRNNDFSNASNSFNWVLSNSNAVNEIPVWATHCHIVRTHNLRTRYFIQGRTSNIAYVSKDVDGILHQSCYFIYFKCRCFKNRHQRHLCIWYRLYV